MHIRIPINFNAMTVAHGKRKEEQTTLCDWVDADIKVLNDLEAPVAMEWVDEGGTRHQIRWFEGSHWAVRLEYESTSVIMSKHNFTNTLAEGSPYKNPLPVGTEHILQKFTSGEMKVFDAADYRSVSGSDRDAVVAKALKNTENLFILDDQVWHKVPEPLYHLERGCFTRNTDHVVFRPVVVIPNPYQSGQSPENLYRADEWDALIHDAEANKRQDVRIDESGRISIFIPEAVTQDADKAALLHILERIVTGHQSQKIGTTTPTYVIRAYCDVADALEAAKENWNPETMGDLETAADTYVAVAAQSESHWQQSLSKILNRWRNRPISIDFEADNQSLSL